MNVLKFIGGVVVVNLAFHYTAGAVARKQGRDKAQAEHKQEKGE